MKWRLHERFICAKQSVAEKKLRSCVSQSHSLHLNYFPIKCILSPKQHTPLSKAVSTATVLTEHPDVKETKVWGWVKSFKVVKMCAYTSILWFIVFDITSCVYCIIKQQVLNTNMALLNVNTEAHCCHKKRNITFTKCWLTKRIFYNIYKTVSQFLLDKRSELCDTESRWKWKFWGKYDKVEYCHLFYFIYIWMILLTS